MSLYPLYGDAAGTINPQLVTSTTAVDEWRDPGWNGEYTGDHPNPSIWPQSDEGQSSRHVATSIYIPPHAPSMVPLAIALIVAGLYLKS